MERRTKTTVEFPKNSTATLIKKYFNLGELHHIDGDLDKDCVCYIPDEEQDNILDDIKTKKVSVKKNFPKGRYVVSDDGEFWSNDNSERMTRLNSENIESADLKKVVKKLPENYTLTYDFVMNDIGLKADVITWIQTRGLDIDTKLTKGAMQEAIIKLYHLSKNDIVEEEIG